MVIDPLFLAFLRQHDDETWHRAVDRLQGAIHPVDRVATRVWFHLFPMRLQQAVDAADDPGALVHHLRIGGRWRLDEQRETSHWFLFGHRYWGGVREAVRAYAARPVAPGSLDLAAQVQQVAREAAEQLAVDASWLVGITAVALRTLQQAGLPTLPDDEGLRPERMVGGAEAAPDRIVSRREAGQSPRLFSLLRGRRRSFDVTFDERPPARSFPIIALQHITTAAALDTHDYRAEDGRCTEGPIPVHCRSCSCGTCWVGVLAGADRLSPVDDKERTTIAALGYLTSSEPHPVIRLSCMAEARGPVTIVIPPWNGQVGARLERSLGEA